MRRSRGPSRRITLTTFNLDEYVCNALAAGADGFLLKDTGAAEILRAVHLVAAGSAMLPPLRPAASSTVTTPPTSPKQPRAKARVDGLPLRLSANTELGHLIEDREQVNGVGTADGSRGWPGSGRAAARLRSTSN